MARMLTYRLKATYRIEPACQGSTLEHVLDLVADDLHPHPVRLSSDDRGVTIAVDLRTADVRHIYDRVALVLEQSLAALRRHWPRCARTPATAVQLVDSSQHFA